MRSIVLPADTSPGFAGRLETALAVARRFDGHVTVQIDTPIDRFVVSDMYGGTFVSEKAYNEACEAGVVLGQRLDTLLGRQDVAFDIEERSESPADALAEGALLADLAVADIAAPWLGDALVRISAPVLALPPAATPARLDGVACVAWDGSRAAARAVRAAVPLLRACSEVHVLTVGNARDAEFPRVDVLRYFSRHGVHAELHTFERRLSVEETLAAYARRLEAGLLLMGAYGHSRLREFIVGGVTRYFLTAGDLPLFLVH